jgi:hypothetical protein
MFSIEGILRGLWELPKVADWLRYGYHYVGDGKLRDVQDGKLWQEIQGRPDFDEHTAVIAIVSDPVEATKAKHGRDYKIVPSTSHLHMCNFLAHTHAILACLAVLGIILSLPPHLRARSGFVMLLGLIHGPKVKSAQPYMAAIAEQFRLGKVGVDMYDARTQRMVGWLVGLSLPSVGSFEAYCRLR